MKPVEENDEAIVNIGREFAFEGLDYNSFKGNTADEFQAFKKGYEEGIKLMQESCQQIKTNDVQEENIKK